MATKLISDEVEGLTKLIEKVRAHKAEAATTFAERAKRLGENAPPNLESIVDFFLRCADAAIAQARSADQTVSSVKTTAAAPKGESQAARSELKGVLQRTRSDVIKYFGRTVVGSAVKWPLPHDEARLPTHARETATNLTAMVPKWKPLEGRAGTFDLPGTVALLTQAADALDLARGQVSALETSKVTGTHDREAAEVALHDLHRGLLESFTGFLRLAGLRPLADEVSSKHHVSHTHPAATTPDPAKPQT